jgi:gliding motility-associated-like protein
MFNNILKEIKKATYTLALILISSIVLGQECGIVYVSPNGAGSGLAGTKSNPANFTYGLTLTSPSDSRIWMAVGNYTIDNTVSIASGITIEGGFDGATWIKSNATQTIINRSALNPDIANLALVAFEAIGRNGFRLQDLNINVVNAPLPSMTVYGIRVVNSSNYNIVRCEVVTGNGGNGAAGNIGANGTVGANGANGQAGDDDSRNRTGRGGNGGASGGGSAGGLGAVLGNGAGLSGLPGGNAPVPANIRDGGGGGGAGCGAHDDLPGGRGGEGTSSFGNNLLVGNGGPGGGGCCDQGNTNCANPRLNGTNGSDGTNGANGTAGIAGVGAHGAGFYIAGNGMNGTDGFGGQGGAGGGGGSGDRGFPSSGCGIGCTSGTGCGGGGGGGGGQGGAGGGGGGGGGGSFPIYLSANGTSGLITDCRLIPGLAGIGGLGATGGNGANGGNGGARGTANAEVGCGGNGGNGGIGGNGGQGGNGGNGESIAIYQNGTSATIQGNSVPGNPPIISVLNSGCINETVLFEAPVSGSWNFGANANPQTANGSGPIQVSYSVLGRKDITFNGTIFSQYIDIFNTGTPVNNTITTPVNPIPSGCPTSFSTSLSGSFYEWIFPNGVIVSPTSGASLQTISNVYFINPGTYTVKVRVTSPTSCCGNIEDSLVVSVTPNSINVSISFQPDTICIGNSVTFTASPSGYQQYTFFINNNQIQQGTSNTFTTSTLNPGDSVTVAAFDGTCYTNPSAVTKVDFYNLQPITLISSDNDNTICISDLIDFTVIPAGYSLYDFFVNGNLVQSSSSNLYAQGNLTNGSVVNAIAYYQGCSAGTSDSLSFVVVNLPQPFAGDDFNICDDTSSIVLNGTPAGGNWFGNGISGNTFYPSVSGPGQFNVWYEISDPSAGCNKFDTLIISVGQRPIINAGADFEVCADTAAFPLSGYSPQGGVWSGSGVTSSGIFDPSISGIGSNRLTYTINGACRNESFITAVVLPLPDVNAGTDKTLPCDNSTVTLDGSSLTFGALYNWSNELGNRDTVSTSEVGSYILVVINQLSGCKASDEVVVFPKSGCGTVLAMPTAFTPNGDGKNDVYKPVYTSTPDNFEIRIFNRWGEKVFETNDINVGWDGTYKDSAATTETYTWTITYTSVGGVIKSEIGTLALLR